jgi:small subunit ribosomal protein S15
MPLVQEVKEEIISQHRINNKDVGSPEVQVSLLTRRISDLTEHLKEHRKDFSSRRGLLTLVSKRRRLLNYVKNDSAQRYRTLIESLGLRG